MIDDVDAEARDLEAEGVGERLDRVLGRVVDAAAGEDELAAHRADVDDPALAGLAHAGQHELAHPHQAEDVGLELPADAVHRDRLDRAALAVAGVVDQGADRAVGSSTSATALAIELLVGDVERQRLAPAAFRSSIASGLRAVA